MKKIILVSFLVFFLFSCGENFEMGKGETGKKVNGFDTGTFIDVTNKNVRATLLDESDFTSLCTGIYSNGRDEIEIKENNEIRVKIKKSSHSDYKDKRVEFSGKYKVKAASDTILYLAMENDGIVMIENTLYSLKDSSKLPCIIAMYGFGENRIEVSSVLEGSVFIQSGTYWKR